MLCGCWRARKRGLVDTDGCVSDAPERETNPAKHHPKFDLETYTDSCRVEHAMQRRDYSANHRDPLLWCIWCTVDPENTLCDVLNSESVTECQLDAAVTGHFPHQPPANQPPPFLDPPWDAIKSKEAWSPTLDAFLASNPLLAPSLTPGGLISLDT